MVTQPDKHKKLTDISPAVKLMRQMFDTGQITKESDPKSVYESNAVFYSNHRLDPFRTRLNNLKKEYCDQDGKYLS